MSVVRSRRVCFTLWKGAQADHAQAQKEPTHCEEARIGVAAPTTEA